MTRFDLISVRPPAGPFRTSGGGREVIVLVVALLLYAAAIVAVAHALAQDKNA